MTTDTAFIVAAIYIATMFITYWLSKIVKYLIEIKHKL